MPIVVDHGVNPAVLARAGYGAGLSQWEEQERLRRLADQERLQQLQFQRESQLLGIGAAQNQAVLGAQLQQQQRDRDWVLNQYGNALQGAYVPRGRAPRGYSIPSGYPVPPQAPRSRSTPSTRQLTPEQEFMLEAAGQGMEAQLEQQQTQLEHQQGLENQYREHAFRNLTYSPDQLRQIQEIETGIAWAQTTPQLEESQRQAVINNLVARRSRIVPMSPEEESPFPEGQDVGQIWEAPDPTRPGANVMMTRDKDGIPRVVQGWSPAEGAKPMVSAKEFADLWKSAQESLTEESATGGIIKQPTAKEVNAQVQNILSAYKAFTSGEQMPEFGGEDPGVEDPMAPEPGAEQPVPGVEPPQPEPAQPFSLSATLPALPPQTQQIVLQYMNMLAEEQSKAAETGDWTAYEQMRERLLTILQQNGVEVPM